MDILVVDTDIMTGTPPVVTLRPHTLLVFGV